MISPETFRHLALSFPETNEQPHFEKPSFRVKGKIFATLDLKNQRACLKLTLVDQGAFSAFDNTLVYPVPGAWGKQGWTYFELRKVRQSVVRDALSCAWSLATPEKKAMTRSALVKIPAAKKTSAKKSIK